MNGILCSSKYCCLIFLLLHFFYLIHFKTGSKCCVTISSSQPLPYTHLKKRFFLCRKSIFRIHRSLAGIATMNITLNLTNRFETFISLSASFGWLGVHLRSRQSYLPSQNPISRQGNFDFIRNLPSHFFLEGGRGDIYKFHKFYTYTDWKLCQVYTSKEYCGALIPSLLHQGTLVQHN